VKAAFSFLVLVALVFTPWMSTEARAEPIFPSEGVQLFATGGEVDVWFAGSDSAYDHRLFLMGSTVDDPFFANHSTDVGTTRSLGSFSSGTELTFMLDVLTTGDRFFTGVAARNPDRVVHAFGEAWAGSAAIPATGMLIRFEDLFGGGDRDFNDLVFVVSNVSTSATPEPTTMALVALGALALGLRRRAQRSKERQTARA
jgi:Domain of unknown function (DUF4114)/PEP-CTERM motif